MHFNVSLDIETRARTMCASQGLDPSKVEWTLCNDPDDNSPNTVWLPIQNWRRFIGQAAQAGANTSDVGNGSAQANDLAVSSEANSQIVDVDNY